MKNRVKKTLVSLLSMLMIFSTVFGAIPASALDLSENYEVSWNHTLTDYDGNKFTFGAGLSAANNPYGYAVTARERSIHDYTAKREGFSGVSSEGVYDEDYVYCFCVEWGIPLPDYMEYTGSSSKAHGNKWAEMSDAQREMIMLILSYGYPNRGDLSTSKDANCAYAVTQYLVWSVSMSWRTNPDNVYQINDKSYPAEGFTGTMTEQLLRNEYFKQWHDKILADVSNHNKKPSFTGTSVTAPTYEMTASGGQYKLTLTDTSGVLSDYYVSDAAGLSTSISGNTLTITSSSPITSEKTIALKRRMPRTNMTSGFLLWSVTGKEYSNQDMVSGVDNDPVPAYLKLKVSTGNLSILKTSQHNNGKVDGFQFEVRNSSNALLGTYTSTSTGKIDIPNLVAGKYTVREINLSSDFVQPTPNPVTVEVKAGQTASVSFDNVKKRGVITIVKSDANPTMGGYSLAGAVFEVRDAGGTLVDTITTGSDGRAQTKILPLGVYRITEKTAPYGFVRDTITHTATISGTQGTAAVVYAPNVGIAEQPQVGRINLVKSNSTPAMGDYSLAGAVFEIKDSGGKVVDTITTNAQGNAQSGSLKLGDYTVTEKSAPYGYVLNTGSYKVSLTYGNQDVSIVYGSTAIPERPQTGIVRVHKTNSAPSLGDYSLAGAVFEVRAAQDIKQTNGTFIYHKGDLADTITTDANGNAQTKELPLGSYTVTEKTAPYGFVLNTAAYPTTLSYGGQDVAVVYSDVTVPERPQTGTVTITKLDKNTGARAQGDSTLNGAVFELYAAEDIKYLNGGNIYSRGELVETLYCGTASSVTSKELPLGSYYYKEKTPPVGYTLDTASYAVKIEYAGQNVSVVKEYGDLKNKVIEGQIAITKHTELADPDVSPENPQIEQPLEGAVFVVYLKSAGSYDNAFPTERDLITTNADGYAKTKLLPYGIYTVREISAPGDLKLVDAFDVFISQEGKVYRYILRDDNFFSLVRITKVDSETGKTIPAAGVSFKVWDVANNTWVTQSYNYPTPTTIDTYETAPDGTLVMPEALVSGDYLLYEQSAPYGYVLSKDPVKFTIHSSQATPEIIEILMANNPAKGIINVEKTGNMLTGVTETQTSFGTQYTPVFSLTGLKGAVFNVVAAEDIYTGDGTLRYVKGTVVDTITTDGNGYTESKQLYLGNYMLIEVTAPNGFVLDETHHSVSLVYENQEVAVVSSQIGICNTRQQVEIALQKLMERPVNAPDDFNAFSDVVFGLFSGEDIKAVDGSVVLAKDSLVALITLDENGKGVVSGELPFASYYVKELQTNIYYQLNDTKYPVNAKYQGQDVATAKIQVNNGGLALPNELKFGQLTIIKTGEMLIGSAEIKNKDEALYQPIYEVVGLPGAEFDVVALEDIYDVYGKLITKKGTVVDHIITDENGVATSKLLHLGRYEVIETKAPYGFVSSTEPYAVTLGMDGEISEIISKTITLQNVRQKAEILLDKVCEIPDGMDEDYNPYGYILFELRAKEDILAVDGSVAIAADALIEYISFEADGSCEIKTDLPFGSYYVQEILTAPGYVLDEKQYDIVFEYNSDAAELVTIAVNNGEAIENRLQRGSLKIIKTFEGLDMPIAGVPFTIVGKTTVGTTVTIEAQTDENGEIMLENLLVGDYTVVELESDLTVGYVLSSEENAIVAADEIAEMTIHNKLQRGDLKIIKTFEGKETPIEGVEFTVKGVSITGVEYEETFATDENGEIFIEGLLIGEYTVQEIGSELTVGYILSDEQTAEIDADEVTEMRIDNKLIRGDIAIYKLDAKTGEPLAGAVFGLYDLDGNLLSEVTTEENGCAAFLGIPYGEYEIKEISAPEGYMLNNKIFGASIKENGEVIKIEVDNKKTPTPDIPQTGDNSNLGFWIGLAGIALGGLVSLIIIKKKKDKDDE